jgi:cytochrome P450
MPWRLVPEEMDPPEFKNYRSIINTLLSPASVRRMRPQISRWITYYIDQFIESGTCDLSEDLCSPVPGSVALEWLGFPREDWRRIYTCMHHLGGYPTGSPERIEAEQDVEWLNGRIVDVVGHRRRRPGHDVISYLLEQEIDGRPLDVERVYGIVWLAIIGGVDTTTSLASFALVRLSRDHELATKMLSDPQAFTLATEEFLRTYAPVRAHARTVAKDVELVGVPLKRGDRILAGEMSASHDENAFEHADAFIPDRFPNRHLAFGLGIHRCPGSHLARAEFAEIVTAVLTRIPDFRVDLDKSSEYPATMSGIGGWGRIHAEFTPGTPSGLGDPHDDFIGCG